MVIKRAYPVLIVVGGHSGQAQGDHGAAGASEGKKIMARKISMIKGAVSAVALMAGMTVAGAANAADPFSIRLTVGSETATRNYTSIEDAINQLDNSGLNSMVSSYTNRSAASVVANIRGLSATLNYDANATTLKLRVPVAGISEDFTGATRDESQRKLEDWFKGSGNSSLTKLLQAAVAETATDPVAGNPNSLMANMAATDFIKSGGQATGSVMTSTAKSGDSRATFGLGARFGQYTADGSSSSSYTLPIGLAFDFADGYQLSFDVPLTLMDTEGAKSYSGSFGIGLKIPVTTEWSLTPGVRAGAVGSIDLGAAGAIYSGTVTSNYNLAVDKNTTVSIGNMAGIYKTLSLTTGDYTIDYDLTNTLVRNGVTVTTDLGLELFGNKLLTSAFVADTRFFGDALYIDNYQEVGIFFSTAEKFGILMDNPLSIGVTYTHGKDFNGFSANFGFKF